MKKDELEEQKKTPYIDAYKEYLNEHNTPFDVPGHHQGNIKTDFDKIFPHKVYSNDVNCPIGMDNIMHPVGCIKEAEDLFAKACNADHARFLINGSTSGILIMIMSVVKAHEKIILPRNVHKSVINALILSGAVPVFVMPEIDVQTEITNQVSLAQWKEAIDNNPDAKAVFIINPTYFGATTDIKEVVKYAHSKNMLVLVDEAHGTHFYFSKKLPTSAMEAGADMSTLSVHKTGGSLTQSSVLLIKGNRVSSYDINKTYNMLNTTSPSSILLASLDAARKYLVFNGPKKLSNAIKLAEYTIQEVNQIKGFKAHGKDHFLENGAYDYDETKVVIEIDKLKLNGFEVRKLLKDKYYIQVELAETYVFLCLFTLGSKEEDAIKLVEALKDISKDYYDDTISYTDHHYMKSFPKAILRPREAYHAPLKVVALKDALGCISKEMIMIYPPGIPLIIPGEAFTQEVIDELAYYKSINANIVSDREGSNEVSVVDEDKIEIDIEKNRLDLQGK